MKNQELSLEEHEKYLLIAKILEDKDCFLKMRSQDAYSILKDLGFKDLEIKQLYTQLLNLKNGGEWL